MQLLYKDTLYELDHHHSPTGLFNIEFLHKVMNLSEEIALAIHGLIQGDAITDKMYTIPLSGNNVLTKVYVEFKRRNNPEFKDTVMQVRKFRDSFLVDVEASVIDLRDIDDYMFTTLNHEIIHIFQKMNGRFGDISIQKNLKGNPRAYINDPIEFEAFLGSIIASIIYRGQLDEFKGISYEDFIDRAFNVIHSSELDFTRDMDDTTKQEIDQILRLFFAKVNQGYFG